MNNKRRTLVICNKISDYNTFTSLNDEEEMKYEHTDSRNGVYHTIKYCEYEVCDILFAAGLPLSGFTVRDVSRLGVVQPHFYDCVDVFSAKSPLDEKDIINHYLKVKDCFAYDGCWECPDQNDCVHKIF